MDRLVSYDWPGNVRELQNLVERALILSHGQPLEFPTLGTNEKEVLVPGAGTPEFTAITLDKLNEKYILRVLDYTNGKVSGRDGAAELLGLNPSTLRSRMKKLGITNRRSSPWTS
jgi:DNA-binding NtrC family response regulator